VLDIDLGQALLRFLLVAVVLPLAVAALATVAIVRLVRDATTRLAVGIYLMLGAVLISPAPVVWRDDHLGFTSSQVLAGFGALEWAVGAIVTLGTLTCVTTRRQTLVLAVCLVSAPVLLSGWALAGFGAAVGLALIPVLGTLEVVLVVGWLAHRRASVASTIDWRWGAGVGAACACVLAAYVYLRGQQAFNSQASAMHLALLGVLACLPVFVLACLRTLPPRPRAG
jgi:hypothetical protein